MKRSLILVVVLLFASMAIFSGCKTEQNDEESTTEKNSQEIVTEENVKESAIEQNDEESDNGVDTGLTVTALIDTSALDPAVGSVDFNISGTVYDTLLKFDKDYKVVGRLSDTWQEADDQLSITFHINDSAKFHDGSKVTANDVVYSFNKLISLPTGAAYIQYIPKAEVIDESHVKIYKATAGFNLLNFLATFSLFIVPEVLESDAENFANHPIGSGPYKFDNIGSDKTVTLVANEDYYLGAPDIKTITVKLPIDASTGVVALQTGEIGMYSNIAPPNFPQISSDPSLVLKKEGGFFSRLVILSGPVFENAKLKEAVYRAINSETVLVVAGANNGTVTNSIYPSKLVPSEYNEAIIVKDRYNEELAKQLLQESGYDVTQPIEFPVLAEYAMDAEVIQAELKKIGLTLDITPVDPNTFTEKLLTGGVSIMLFDFGGPSVSLYDLLLNFTTAGDPYKMFGTKSPELDALVLNIAQETDAAVIKQDTIDACSMLIAENLVIPLYEKDFNVAFSSRFETDTVIGTALMAIQIGDIKIKK